MRRRHRSSLILSCLILMLLGSLEPGTAKDSPATPTGTAATAAGPAPVAKRSAAPAGAPEQPPGNPRPASQELSLKGIPSSSTLKGEADPGGGARERLARTFLNVPARFEVNQGQTDPQVKFLSRGRGYTLFLTGNEAVLALQNTSRESKRNNGPAEHVSSRAVEAGWPKQESKIQNAPSPDSLPPTVLLMRLVAANADAKVTGLDEVPGKSNYFIGNDPKKWRTNVPNYGKVRYENVYPGVDLVYYGNQRQLEYDFVVAPGACRGGACPARGGAASSAPARRYEWRLGDRDRRQRGALPQAGGLSVVSCQLSVVS